MYSLVKIDVCYKINIYSSELLKEAHSLSKINSVSGVIVNKDTACNCVGKSGGIKMSMTDPIADMLTRIRNAGMVAHETVDVPASKLKVQLAKLLKEEGFISDYEVKEEGKFKVLTITLKYDANRKSVITKLVRVSKPGLRSYSKSKNLQKSFRWFRCCSCFNF